MRYITNEVCAEVYDIIHHLDDRIYERIPAEFINFINQHRDEKIIVNIDYSKSINEQEIQHGTRVLLSLIYRDYLCGEEERKELIKQDREELKQIETKLQEKYNPNNLFKKTRDENVVEKDKQEAIIIYKETIFRKIMNKIKKWF